MIIGAAVDPVRVVVADQLAKSGEAVKSGPIGLAVILLLCIGCYFLFKSMSKHLRTVREKFPSDAVGPSAPKGAGASTAVDLHKTSGETPPNAPDAPPPAHS